MIKMFSTFFSASLIALLISPLKAEAGREAGNGGDAVLTPGGVRFLDLVRLPGSVLLDLEDEGLIDELSSHLSRHPGYAQTTYFGADSAPTALVQNKIVASLKTLSFRLVPGPLPQTGDRGFVELPWNQAGRIVRLALQDINAKRVIVDRDVYAQLPRADKLAFLLHEALIRVYHDDLYIPRNHPLRSIEKIANLVNATFRTDRDPGRGLTARSVARYLCDAKIPVAVGQYNNKQVLPGTLAPHTAYPPRVLAFLMTENACEIREWTTQGNRRGSHMSRVLYPAKFLHTWRFRELDEEGRAHNAFVIILDEYDKARSLIIEALRPDHLGYVQQPLAFGPDFIRIYTH